MREAEVEWARLLIGQRGAGRGASIAAVVALLGERSQLFSRAHRRALSRK
jgi:hypothetical protein